MKEARIGIGLLLCGMLVAGLACEMESTRPDGGSTQGDAEIRIDSDTLNCEKGEYSSYYDCTLTGTVTNIGDGDASMVEVNVEFFSSSGIKIKSDWDYIGELRAGGSAYYDLWYFDQRYPDDYDIWAEWHK